MVNGNCGCDVCDLVVQSKTVILTKHNSKNKNTRNKTMISLANKDWNEKCSQMMMNFAQCLSALTVTQWKRNSRRFWSRHRLKRSSGTARSGQVMPKLGKIRNGLMFQPGPRDWVCLRRGRGLLPNCLFQWANRVQVRASIASTLELHSGPFLYDLNCFGSLFQQAKKYWLDI